MMELDIEELVEFSTLPDLAIEEDSELFLINKSGRTEAFAAPVLIEHDLVSKSSSRCGFSGFCSGSVGVD